MNTFSRLCCNTIQSYFRVLKVAALWFTEMLHSFGCARDFHKPCTKGPHGPAVKATSVVIVSLSLCVSAALVYTVASTLACFPAQRGKHFSRILVFNLIL